MKISMIAAVAVFTATLSAAQASVVTYDEAVDGDIEPILVRSLGVGTNSLTGSAVSTCALGAACQSAFTNDIDDFFLQLASGLLASGSLKLTVTGPDGGFVNSSSVPVVGGGILQASLISGVNEFLFADLVAGPRIFIDSSPFNSGTTGPLSRTIDWELNLTVTDPNATTPVPLPAGLPLLLGGFGLLTLIRRKDQRD